MDATTQKTNEQYETLNPIIARMYKAAWDLQAIQYMERELNLSQPEAGEPQALADMAYRISRESTNDLLNLLEELCDVVGVAPDCRVPD